MSLLETALHIALKAHRGQKDKAGKPYITHPLRVMHQLENEHEQAAALLHDVLEDTNLTSDDLRTLEIPEVVIEAVEALTRKPGGSYDKYLKRVAANPIARAVKLADLHDNLRLERLGAVSQADLKRLNKYLKAKQYLETQ